MSLCFRTIVIAAVLLLVATGIAPAADRKEIDAALKKGSDWIKSRYTGKGFMGVDPGIDGGHGIGPPCLSGLALLESGVAVDDPALVKITELVRNAAYFENRTYQISLCLMYLDRLGDPADVPLIQALAVRLLVGQGNKGGWSYTCVANVSQADAQFLRGLKPGNGGKFHPDVERYAHALTRPLGGGVGGPGGDGDNSNTQFAVLAVWLARKHGVPVEDSLRAVEQRFLVSQNARTGGWGYLFSGGAAAGPLDAAGSPSMYCAGLIGLATAVARREERLAKVEAKKEEPKVSAEAKKNPGDPFFNPPTKAGESKKNQPKRPPDNLDRAVQFAFNGLGTHVAESARAGRGALYLQNGGGHGHHDLYFFWSLERVGVLFAMDKMGGVDWYEAGAHTLVATQGRDGSWPGNYSPEVNTTFAILFLCKSNLARDLSGKIKNELSTELRAGVGPDGNAPRPGDFKPAAGGTTDPFVPTATLPGVTGSEVGTLAGELLRATDKEWAAVLKTLREGKGSVYTQALVTAMGRLDGDRLKAAREALAERLTRMTAETLRAMAKSDEPELRRGAVLAMAMKDDKAHIPDLVDALLDDEDLVVRASRAGLKSLTGEDFGPRANATIGDKKIAIAAWKDWMNKQKK